VTCVFCGSVLVARVTLPGRVCVCVQLFLSLASLLYYGKVHSFHGLFFLIHSWSFSADGRPRVVQIFAEFLSFSRENLRLILLSFFLVWKFSERFSIFHSEIA
jgi:hypothetical protein